MVVYYINKKGENLSDCHFPIKKGDICMLYDGVVIKTIYIDSEREPDSIWRDFKFIDTKSLKGYQFPATDSIICAANGNKRAIGDIRLLTKLTQECKGEWLLDFLKETSAVLAGFTEYWDLEVLKRLIGDEHVEIIFEDEEILSRFVNVVEKTDADDIDINNSDADDISLNKVITNFCLTVSSCFIGQIDDRNFRIVRDTLMGFSQNTIASRYGLTSERIRQIVKITISRIEELQIKEHQDLIDIKAENLKLNVQRNLLKERNIKFEEQLKEQHSVQELSKELIGLLETPVVELNLSVRAINALERMGIKKFAEIPQISSAAKIINVKNSGRKTVHDIFTMLNDFELSFGMTYQEIIDVLNSTIWRGAKSLWVKEVI